jgi:uncharacterized protein (DUF2384 family)
VPLACATIFRNWDKTASDPQRNEETATRWLRRTNWALGGASPLESIDTERGARTVEDVLGRIATAEHLSLAMLE